MTKTGDFRTMIGIPAALLLGAAIVAGAYSGVARAQTAMPEAQQAPAAEASFSDQELQSYASAVVKVQEISESAREKLKATKDLAASDAIQKDAETKAVAVVKQQGLSVEKYNQIALATETNPEIRSKVLDFVGKTK